MFSITTRIEIQFGDCDPAGIVYYPNYFRFFDNATAALLSAAFGMHKRQWMGHYGIAGIPTVDTDARFIKPSRFGDQVEITSIVAELGRSSFSVGHVLMNDGAVAVEAHEKRVWVVRAPDDSIQSSPLPDDVRRLLVNEGKMSNNETVLQVREEAGVAHLVLNRPAKRNALNDALVAALDAYFAAVPDSVRVIVISGAGGHFSSGLDLSEQVHRAPLEVMAHSRNWHRAMAQIQHSPVPVVAAMSGAVMGGELEFGAACHVRVAEETVRFQMPEGQRGIFIGGGGSVRISRLIGADRLTEMILTGRIYSGTEGERLGLAHYVVAEGQAVNMAMELAERIAGNSRTINAIVIQTLSQIAAMPPDAGLYAESLAAALSQTGPDAAEGLSAFLEKRAPKFR